MQSVKKIRTQEKVCPFLLTAVLAVMGLGTSFAYFVITKLTKTNNMLV